MRCDDCGHSLASHDDGFACLVKGCGCGNKPGKDAWGKDLIK